MAARSPELAPYAELLGIALTSAAEPAWALAAPAVGNQRLSAGTPALHRASLMLPRHATERLYQDLVEHHQHQRPDEDGETNRPPGVGPQSDLLASLRDAICLRGALEPVVQLTALPVLQAVARACELTPAGATWLSGVCPVCAAWPAIAESRGLDRPRVLRCGRCSTEWQLPWQLCPFCANDDHRALSYLYSENGGEARKVFVCERCHGYLKTIATLGPIPPLEVPVEDLATLELDLVALDRGFQRPEVAGFALELGLKWAP